MPPRKQVAGVRQCLSCGSIEAEGTPLGRSGLCVDCWWQANGWNYYAFRTGEITAEQRAALVAEFGEALETVR